MISNLIAVLGVACYETGRLLVDVGIGLGALDGRQPPPVAPLPDPDACPDVIPDALLVDR